jgi:UDP-N-acetylglucosamine transferase subunit ALG13
MILLTVGTHKFDTLVERVDTLAGEGRLREEVVAQIGNGTYIPKHCQWFRLDRAFDRYLTEASLVVSHGGVTLYEALRRNKRVVGVANLGLAGGGQGQISNLRRLSADGHLIWCEDLNLLDAAINSSTVLKPYPRGDFALVSDLVRFIDDEAVSPEQSLLSTVGETARRS